MLTAALLFGFFAVFVLFLAFIPGKNARPKLNLDPVAVLGAGAPQRSASVKKRLAMAVFGVMAKMAIFNKALTIGPLGRRIAVDLSLARISMSVEEFLLIKELVIAGFLGIVFFIIKPPAEIFLFWVLVSVAAGYYLPELWLGSKGRGIKDSIVRDLPDMVDLLGLCVNAGLDFMMALKYVIEKSRPSMIIEELRAMMQEISVGKPRRDALRDMARKYELPDLSTFTRTLIQADRMGTSISEAFNVLSEDMRVARFRRGETIAMKAPLKMLVPLLFFIFPVVAVLVAGPVFLEFFQNSPLEGLGK